MGPIERKESKPFDRNAQLVQDRDMDKPITITKLETGFSVTVNAEAARRFGAKPQQVEKAVKRATTWTGACETREDAMSRAHFIGRYFLGFGDMVFTYVQEV